MTDYVKIDRAIESLHKSLLSRVKGQENAINSVVSHFRRGEAGLTDPRQPKAAVIALGPTGVGKTETVKVVAEELFNDPGAAVMLYMSSYKTRADLEQFLGTSRESGDLERRLKAVGEGGKILLLDEIEKAHSEILDLLLQILDEAEIRFHNGNTFQFSGWYIWATSNIGSEISTKGKKPSKTRMEMALVSALKERLRPEIVERFNCILTYNRLETQTQLEIAEAMILNEIERLNQVAGVNYQPENILNIVGYVREHGYTAALGARRMREAVRSALQLAYYPALVAGLTEGKIQANVSGLLIAS